VSQQTTIIASIILTTHSSRIIGTFENQKQKEDKEEFTGV